MRAAAVVAAAVVLLGAAAPASVAVSPSEIASENARWIAFGVHLPPGGIVLDHPYRAPYSSRSFVVPWGWYQQFYTAYRARHDYQVRASDLRADLPVLRLLIEKTYAGYGPAKARGWNWGAWFASWDASLKTRGDASLPLTQAFAPWARLEAFQLDNHSGIPAVTSFVSGSVSAVLSRAPERECTSMTTDGHTIALNPHDAGQMPHAVTSWNGATFSPAWYVSYPLRDGTASSIECGSPIALHMTVSSSAPGRENPLQISARPSYENLGDGIAYVRMPTFTDANDDALTDLFSRTAGIGKERLVLLDLRGNEGGNAPTALAEHVVCPKRDRKRGRSDANRDGVVLPQRVGLRSPAAAGKHAQTARLRRRRTVFAKPGGYGFRGAKL